MEEATHLKWTNFHENLNNTFRSLKGSQDFIDVTLACEDGQKIGVHKAILAASSPLFHSLLNGKKNDHQTVYLTGVKSEDVSSVVDFMYCGQTKVHRTNVDSFLAVTNDLKLEGLFGKGNINDDEEIYTIAVPFDENSKDMQSTTSQMTKRIKYVSESAQQTHDSKRAEFIQEVKERENGNEKEKKSKMETEHKEEKEQGKNKENKRENKKERENKREMFGEDEKENKREIEKQKQREKDREKAIEKNDKMERGESKEKETQKKREQEREKLNEKGKENKVGHKKESKTENLKENEQTMKKTTETKIKDTDENTTEKAKVCKLCRETFTSSQIYREHKDKDHNIECPLQKTCKLRFVVDYYKNLHLYQAHKIGSRPWESLRPKKEEKVTKLMDAPLFGPEKAFVCKKCKKHFYSKDQELHHEGLGHNYSCAECDRSYIVEAALKDHKATHVKKTTVSPTKVATQPLLFAVEKRAFLCDQCDKNFTDRQQLRKHERERHQARCKATECNLTFGTHFTTRCIPSN